MRVDHLVWLHLLNVLGYLAHVLGRSHLLLHVGWLGTAAAGDARVRVRGSVAARRFVVHVVEGLEPQYLGSLAFALFCDQTLAQLLHQHLL